MRRTFLHTLLIAAAIFTLESIAYAYSPCPFFELALKEISPTEVQVSWKWVSGLKPSNMTLSILRTAYLIEEPVEAFTIRNAPLSGSFKDTPPQPDHIYHYNTEVEVDGLYCQSRRYAVAFGDIAFSPGRGTAPLYSGQAYCDAKTLRDALRVINARRGKRSKLKLYQKLRWAAQAQSAEMAHLQNLTYIGLIERVQETGYTPHALGQAISVSPGPFRAVFNSWMKSKTIKNYVLSAASITDGLACVTDQSGNRWWTLVIGQR